MKIQCDVCCKDEASVYCSADEAALCDSCDYQVHHANKLASKHYRFNLVGTDGKECPNCDVCQDRAILCRACDDSIHSANEHTRKHDRFLLTGVKLSAKAGLYARASENLLTSGCDLVPDFKSQLNDGNNKVAAEYQSLQKSVSYSSVEGKSGSYGSNESSISDLCLASSSISEYLMETLPGWCVEDLLDSSSAPFGYPKQYNNGLNMPFSDADLLGQDDLMCSILPDNSTTWASQVPSVSTPLPHVPQYPPYLQFSTRQSTNMKGSDNNAKVLIEDGFTVPQIISPQSSVGFKRSRLV